MANKNTAGRLFTSMIKRINRIHSEIDRRATEGKYNEESSHNCKLTTNGERVWSF